MKKYVQYTVAVCWLILALSIPQYLFAQNKGLESIQWISFAQLEKAMQQKPKYIFIEVETGWCVYCKMLNKTTLIKQQVIKALNKDFYALKLNPERPQKIRFGGNDYPFITQGNGQGIQGLALALKAQSYPSILILSPNYEVLHRHKGYIKAKKLAPLLSFLGEEKYKKQSWRAFIATYKKNRKQKERNRRRRKEKK